METVMNQQLNTTNLSVIGDECRRVGPRVRQLVTET